MADVPRTATSAAVVIAGYRIAVAVFLAPKLDFFLLCALDAPLPHLDIVLNLSLGKLPVLPEYDIEAETEYAQCDKDQRCK